jgi:integrase/recombinase XerD
MILSQAVEQYILHKRLLGARFRGEASQLRAFTKAIGDCDMHLVKPELVLRFLEGTGSVTSFWFTKYHTLNSSIATLLPVSTVQGAPLSVLHAPEPFEPYIYTNRDIEQLVDAADALRQRYYFGRGIEPHTIRTLLLLLYGTGLRISEALS